MKTNCYCRIACAITAAMLLITQAAKTQNTFPSTGAAGIGTTTPNASSLLEIKSTTKGLLIPRLTKTQRDAITKPATGLMIYQINSSPGFYYYSGTAWKSVSGNSVGGLNANLFIGQSAGASNASGYGNIALGKFALFSNIAETGNIAVGDSALYTAGASASYSTADNVAIGRYALMNNTYAAYNIAIGRNSLNHNTTGGSNVSVGTGALYNNTTGYNNLALGFEPLSNNTTGTNNISLGTSAMNNNSSGTFNIAIGAGALYSNVVNSHNTAIGPDALFYTTASEFNTAVGYNAGTNYDNGYNNVFCGANADVNAPGYYNVIAIGQSTVCTASSQVTIGNTSTNSYRAYANWSNISDGRYKKNVKEDVPGLIFINKLRPVTYNLDAAGLDNFLHKNSSFENKISSEVKAVQDKAVNEKEQIRYTGFVAQEVEKAANDIGYNFSGVDKAKDANDVYGLRYAEFVVPLVKAVQELSRMNDEKDSAINSLQNQVNDLKAMIVSQSSTAISSASLQQNIPNPFDHTTTINYILPQTYSSAKIIVTDKSGKTLKELNINAKGKGSLNIDTSTLASGAYQYSLIVDGRLIDTKQMEHIK
jgi:hypothetical protein